MQPSSWCGTARRTSAGRRGRPGIAAPGPGAARGPRGASSAARARPRELARDDAREIAPAQVLFAKIGGRIVTPPLEGTILPGVTRDCVIALCRRMKLQVEERRLALDELRSAHRSGSLEELFGTGTASLALAIGELAFGNERLSLPAPAAPLSARLREELSAIQRGEAEDAFGWLEKV